MDYFMDSLKAGRPGCDSSCTHVGQHVFLKGWLPGCRRQAVFSLGPRVTWVRINKFRPQGKGPPFSQFGQSTDVKHGLKIDDLAGEQHI